jgi:hypothetical protein
VPRERFLFFSIATTVQKKNDFEKKKKKKKFQKSAQEKKKKKLGGGTKGPGTKDLAQWTWHKGKIEKHQFSQLSTSGGRDSNESTRITIGM